MTMAKLALLLVFFATAPTAAAAAETGIGTPGCPPIGQSAKQEASPFDDEDPEEPLTGPDEGLPEPSEADEGPALDKSSVPSDEGEEAEA